MSFNSPVAKRLIKGAGGHGFLQLSTILQRLVEVPLFLYFMGAQVYGEWLILAVIPAYLSLSDLGFVGVANRELVIAVGRNDRKLGLKIFQSGWVIISALSVGVIAIFMIATLFYPFSSYIVSWFDFIVITPNVVSWVIAMLLVYVLLGLQVLLIHGAFSCEGYNGESAFLQGVSIYLEFSFVIIVLFNGGGVIEVAGAYVVGRALGLGIMLSRLAKRNDWVRFGVEKASISKIKEMMPLTMAGLAFPLGNAMNIQGLVLVVGALLGPTSVVIFSTLRTLTRTAISVVYLINRSIQPELGRAYGSGNYELLRKIYRMACRAAVWVSVGICVFLSFTGGLILDVWTQSKIEMDWSLFYILLTASLFNALWNTSFQIAYATNRYQKIAKGYLFFYGIISVSLGYMLVLSLGMNGVALSILIVEFFMVVYINYTTFYLLDEKFGKWLLNIFKPPGFNLLK